MFSRYDDEMKGFFVIAKKFISRGESVNMPAMFTGANNSFSLIKWGYMNPLRNTTFPFFVELNKQDPLYNEKCSLTMNRFTSRTFDISSDLNHE